MSEAKVPETKTEGNFDAQAIKESAAEGEEKIPSVNADKDYQNAQKYKGEGQSGKNQTSQEKVPESFNSMAEDVNPTDQ